MKKSASLLVMLMFSQTSFAEWQLINENDPTDPIEMYVDFHHVEHLSESQLQVPMKTSTWPQSYVSSYPMALYEPYVTAFYIIDCRAQTVTTHSQQLLAKLEPSEPFINVFDTFDSVTNERSTRSLVLTDMVDNLLYQKLCQGD